MDVRTPLETLLQTRLTEFPQLHDIIHLDHAGATLYSRSQLQTVVEDITSHLYGNPHTMTSRATSEAIERTRLAVLSFLKVDATKYSVVFTSGNAGATAALKLVGECFPWSGGSEFRYTLENHNSVLGIREYAMAKGASFTALDRAGLEAWLAPSKHSDKAESKDAACCLFAFPSECNFSGERFELDLVDRVKNKGGSERWFVLVDVAKHVATAPMDLSQCEADFFVMSFYKIFGYPTGLGALVVHKDTAPLLTKKYFGGGTLLAAVSDGPFRAFRPGISERLEDGTNSFLAIAAAAHGFAHMKQLGMDAIQKHVAALTTWTFHTLKALRHPNGSPVCEIYGAHEDGDGKQGPVINFNLKRKNGDYVGYSEVDKLAGLNGINLRTGFFCNPGACQKWLGLSREQIAANVEAGHNCWDDIDIVDGKPTGSVRISFGYMSTKKDAEAFVDFVQAYFMGGAEYVPATLPTAPTGDDLTLESITLFPIKSCSGMHTQEWPIGDCGLLYDREWTIVDEHGSALGQKRAPKMFHVHPHVDLERDVLTVSAPGMDPLVLPLSPAEIHKTVSDVRVCGNSVRGLSYGEDVDAWFSRFLGKPCHLIRKLAGRTTSRASTDSTTEDPKISFANDSQFLLASLASSVLLQKHLQEEIKTHADNRKDKGELERVSAEPIGLFTDRFRANLVVRGGSPHQEDHWELIEIDGIPLRVSGECGRCTMVCIDQKTGERGREPLLTLASYRRRRGKVLFGMFFNLASHDNSGSVLLRAHSPIRVIRMAP